MATSSIIVSLLCCWVGVQSQDTLQISFDLKENTLPRTVVGNVATEAKLFENSTDDNSNVLYEFSNPSTHFLINSTTGDVMTSSVPIDRETRCTFAEFCTIQFVISVKGNIMFKLVAVTVNIIDENDNTPTFEHSNIQLNISETASVGLEFSLGRADDPDMGVNNSIMTYELLQNGSTFDVVMIPENFGSFLFKLRVNGSLNRELKDHYSLKIEAKDGGVRPNKGVLNIDVQILDINDNEPEFLSELYNVTIEEDIPVDTVIIGLTATDSDAGDNGRVGYEISQRQPNVIKIKELFGINAVTGELLVIKDLLYEAASSYSFFVDAYDHGVSALSTQTTVTVNVKNVRNSPPILKLNLKQESGDVDVWENVPIETFVLHFTVEDKDVGPNGNVSCSLDNTIFALRPLGGINYKVIVNGELDREVIPVHDINVTCSDYGSPSLSASQQFRVQVKDKNDNAPTFDKKLYSAAIEENNNDPVGIILQVAASDLDTERNAYFEYVLGSDAYGKLSINNNTGVVYAVSPFDREENDVITFSVFAVDKGTPSLTGTTTVSVTIIDVNDNTPVLTQPSSELTVVENATSSMYVGLLTAVDGDVGQNGNFTFSIAPSSSSYPFVLYPNGVLQTTAVIDREFHNQYELPVIVRDQGTESLSSTQYVTVHILDVNDNAPIVTFPNLINDTVKFVYPDFTYNVVTTVAAHDLDAGENQTLSYYIVGGNEARMFAIDEDIGEITVERFVDITHEMTVTLELEVKDNGKSPKSTRAVLRVQLVYSNGTNVTPVGDGMGNKYVIISIVVVVATVLFAVAIVAVIVFLRSLDRHKHGDPEADMCTSCSDCVPSSSNVSGPPSFSPDRSSNSSEDGRDNLRKKKEVTFILDNKLPGNNEGLNKESNTDTNNDSDKNRFYDTAPVSPRHVALNTAREQDKIDSHMKSLKIQKFLWEAKAREWEQENLQVPQSPVGDSESETSRETITCDSGRGGSEDDVSTTSPTTDERGNFSFTEGRQQTGKHVTFSPPPYTSIGVHETTTKRQNTQGQNGGPPPRPPPYRNTKMDFRNTAGKADPISTNYNLTKQNVSYNSNLLTVPHPEQWGAMYMNNKNYQSNNGGNFAHVRHDSMTSLRSNDDDGGSTTTSGSYTLDQDELDMDCFPAQRDVVV